MARAGGPGSFVFGDEERKEVMEVLEGRYLFRYGAADTEGFTHKVVDFEEQANVISNSFSKCGGSKAAVEKILDVCSR